MTLIAVCLAYANALGDDKIGLVLGGGGAKGAAEIGTLYVLEEEGVRPDYIVGTSIGAIIGALYAVGYKAAEIDSLFMQEEWIDVFAGSVSGKRTIAEMFEEKLRERMPELNDSMHFDDLPIPYRCVAVDLNDMKEVVLDSGSLAQAMRASMSVPGVFKPVKVDGMRLVDGGALNNLPVDVAANMGADKIVAVDLQQNQHEDKKDAASRPKLTKTLGALGKLGNKLDWLISRPDRTKYNANKQRADVYIHPNLSGFSSFDFNENKMKAMFNRGKKAANKLRQKLRQLRGSRR